MAEQLQHQNSNVAYEKKYSGCMWSFFQFFDYHQRLRNRKMLTDQCHGDDKRYAGKKYTFAFSLSTMPLLFFYLSWFQIKRSL